MSTKLQNLIAFVCLFGLVVFLGCSAFQDVLTPSYIPPQAIKYADENGPSILPWTTLFDSRRIKMKMAFVHSLNQITDRMEYEYLNGLTQFHIAGAEQLQAKLFSPTGPLGLFLPTVLGGTAGTLLLSKPSDKKKIAELEKEANGKETI